MKLLYPEFLYALSFLVIPILIHLFNFRKYKLIRFSQVQLLQDIKKQTQSTSKLRHVLVLISRLLMISALVLAFCQPYFPNEENTLEHGKKGVSIYIDNSFSMQSKIEDGRLFDLAKNKALSIVESYNASDKFQLLTNDFEGKHQRWLNKAAFIDALQEIEINSTYRDLKAVVQRQMNSFEDQQLIPRIFIISDLQKNAFNLEEIEVKSNLLTILPVQAKEVSNVSLAAMHFNNPYRLRGQRELIEFTLENFDDKKVEGLSVQFKLNEQLKTPLTLTLPEKDTLSKQIQYKSEQEGWQKATISIKDYPINFDDTLYFSYLISSSVEMLHLYEDSLNSNVQRLFEKDSFINYTSQNSKQLDFKMFSKHSFILLDQLKDISSALQNELSSFVKEGGSLFIIPSSKIDKEAYYNFFNLLQLDQLGSYHEEEISLSQLNTQAELYQDVFKDKVEHLKLPSVKGYWNIQELQSTNKHQLLRLSNGNAYLNEYKVDKGKVFLIASGLSADESNFSRHAIFVPTLYNMALQSQIYQPPYHTLGEDEIVLSNIQKTESPVRIVGNGIDVIPPQRYIQNQLHIQLNNEIRTAGHYQLLQKDNFLGLLSLNYNRLESDLKTYTPKEIKDISERKGINLKVIDENGEHLKNQISYLEQGTPLWKYFIIFALIFLAIEVVLLRILK